MKREMFEFMSGESVLVKGGDREVTVTTGLDGVGGDTSTTFRGEIHRHRGTIG